MRSAAKVGLVAAGVVLLGGAALWLLTPKPPGSLAAAFERHRQDLAGNYCVLLPLSSEMTLGHRTTDASPSDPRSCRKNVEPNSCFFTPPPKLSDSLEELSVQYATKNEISAELTSVFHAQAGERGTAKLLLKQLRLAHALGVLNPNGPCAQDGTYPIVTGLLLAQRAVLSTGTAAQASGAAKPGGELEGTGAKSTWSRTEDGTVAANNLVLGGAVQNVRVSKIKMRGGLDLQSGINLTENPQPGRREDLPDGIEGYLSIGSYSASERWLAVTLNAPLQVQAPAWEGVPLCQIGTEVKLELGKQCSFALGGGNTVVGASWNLDRERNVLLSLVAYRTEYKP